MYELTTGADTLGLQSIAEMAELGRHRRYWSRRQNACLVTANYSLNCLSILNILNGFG
jgi:hypothetical protein